MQIYLSRMFKFLKPIIHTKFLRVILSSNLSWRCHADMVLNKISKNIGIISKVRHLIPVHLTLVEPYIFIVILFDLVPQILGPLIGYCESSSNTVAWKPSLDSQPIQGPCLENFSFSQFNEYYQLSIFMYKLLNK